MGTPCIVIRCAFSYTHRRSAASPPRRVNPQKLAHFLNERTGDRRAPGLFSTNRPRPLTAVRIGRIPARNSIILKRIFVMPTYEYACSACGHEWEQEQRIVEPALDTCPSCQQKTAKRLVSAGNFILKGGGWYADLYSKPGGSSSSRGGSSGGSSASSTSKVESTASSSSTSASTAPAATASSSNTSTS